MLITMRVAQEDRQLGDSREIPVGGNDSKAALLRGGRDQGVDVADEAGAVGLAQGQPDIGVALQDRVGQEVRVDLPQEQTQLGLMLGEGRQSSQVFHDFAVDENAGGCLPLPQPRFDQRDRGRFAVKVGCQWRGVQQVAPS